ncbi:MAG: tetratricopeptide repeat protein [Candidatus Omnitrophica bacterium]|nr:tetratricopeptide repeat protein [Candidatus Omnitrophota bacterium]
MNGQKRFLPFCLVFLAVSFCLPVPLFAEKIILKSKKEIEGKVVEKTDKYLKFDFQGITLTYYIDDIESVDGIPVRDYKMGASPAARLPVKNPSPVVQKSVPNPAALKNATGSHSIPGSEPSKQQQADEKMKKAKDALDNALQAFKKNNLDQAIAYSTEALKTMNASYEAYSLRGQAYHLKGNYGPAFSDFNKAVELDPANALLYKSRGDCFYDANQFDNAISDYSKAIEIDPSFGQAFYSRAEAKYYKGNIDAAILDYN